MNLSFAGCGFLGIYHVGVAAAFRTYAPHLLLNKISGASAGSIAACCLLCDAPLGSVTSDVLRVAAEAREQYLGPFSPNFNIQEILRQGLDEILPDDAHKIVTGRLHISVTRVYDRENVILSHFRSKEELITAILCTAFIPVFSGFLPPKFRGIRYMDGCYSDNLPVLDENTITISPFCGETDICPRDDSKNIIQVNVANTSIEISRQNLYRFTRILFPPKPEVLSKMCTQGFDDALRFLHRNNLIQCSQCLHVQSVVSTTTDMDETYERLQSMDESYDEDPNCDSCKIQRQEAQDVTLPPVVNNILDSAIDGSSEKKPKNWFFKQTEPTFLNIATFSYNIPVEWLFNFKSSVVSVLPDNFVKLRTLIDLITNYLSDLAGTLNKDKLHTTTKVITKMAIRQYRSANFKGKPSRKRSGLRRVQTAQNTLDVNLYVNLDEPIPHTQEEAIQFQKDAMDEISRKVPEGMENDHFDEALHVCRDQEAAMVYFYTDENNKVQITELFALNNDGFTNMSSKSDSSDVKYSMSESMLSDESYDPSSVCSDPESEWHRPTFSEAEVDRLTNKNQERERKVSFAILS